MTPMHSEHPLVNFLKQLPDMRYVTAWIGATILILGVAYSYLLNTTVINIVERKTGEEKLAELDTSLSSYEFSYISKTSHMTLDDALALGYVEELSPTYVYSEGGSRLTYAR